MTDFKKAERKQAFLKIALTGPSGSGKTYSSLQLAFGLGQRVALIDTESGSASLYADLGEYDTLEISPPFTVKKYVDAIAMAVKQKYDVLIIDSLSHAWAGEGGLLAQKESLDSRGGNSFANWASITKQHERMKAAILQAPIHTIVTMRSKQQFVLVERNGKQVPQKVGMAPIQRDGIEYDFTIVLDIGMSHQAHSSKDRTGLFNDTIAKLTPAHGRMMKEWLAEESVPQPDAAHPSSTESQLLQLGKFKIVHKDLDGELRCYWIADDFVVQVAPMSEDQIEEVSSLDEDWRIWAMSSNASIRVGKVRLPLFTAEDWASKMTRHSTSAEEEAGNGKLR